MPESATFDLVLLHYGNGEPPSCPHCRAVSAGAGPLEPRLWVVAVKLMLLQVMLVACC